MNKLRKAETGEEEKEGDKEQEIIEGRRRRGEIKTRSIRFRSRKFRMGCETQYERENQEEPGVIKGDTQKFQLFWGGQRCFLCFFWLVHTNQNFKKGKKKR